MNDLTAVAMSGGVDSSAAALLLRQEGRELAGVTLRLTDNALAGLNGESACCSLDDVEDAQAAARRLGFPHYVFNFTACFCREVVDPFVRAYEAGRPPTPARCATSGSSSAPCTSGLGSWGGTRWLPDTTSGWTSTGAPAAGC